MESRLIVYIVHKPIAEIVVWRYVDNIWQFPWDNCFTIV